MPQPPDESLPPHDLQRRLDENPNNRMQVYKDFFAEREADGDIEGAAYTMLLRQLEVERQTMPLKQASPILMVMTILGFIAGIIFAGFGVWLVYLGSAGQTEFSFFGQTFKSANVGIAAIFIGGATVVLLARSVLKTIRHLK